MPESLSAAELEALRRFDTPTICNALEIAAPDRRARGFTTRHLHCIFPALPPIVGYARTATVRAKEPGPVAGVAYRDVRFAYFDYVASGPAPRVSVIQDLDGREAGFGSFWGEVNTAVHKALGCLGVVTDGSVRDLDQIAPGFQLIAGMVGPSHAHVHLDSFDCEVNVAGMLVRTGDLVHADRHGAVVIPVGAARGIVAAAERIQRREAVILGAARRPGATAEELKRAYVEADKIQS
ncbi:MAG: RraA family protein [Alphaproteobacteria bacterium]